jgi:hypothetical protein
VESTTVLPRFRSSLRRAKLAPSDSVERAGSRKTPCPPIFQYSFSGAR